MRSASLKITILIWVIIFSSFYAPSFAIADNHIIPIIDEGDPPTIDGIIQANEWNSSILYSTSLNDADTQVRVTTNKTHLFIGFNFTVASFPSVNNTIPAYNNTVANYTLGYNNQTHDWFSIIFDSNLDKMITGSEIGSGTSPDDVIVIDQYNQSAYDGYANGSKTNVFFPDSSINYNGTVNDTLTGGLNGTVVNLKINGTTLLGANGTNDVYVNRTNIRSSGQSQISYEIIKPLRSNDIAGYDFNLDVSKILQFKIIAWSNSLANDTLATGDTSETEWFSLRVNETGNGLRTAEPSSTTINIMSKYIGDENVDAMDTVLSIYGFDVTRSTSAIANTSLNNFDLNIFFLGAESTMSDTEIQEISSYVRLGGNAIIILSDEVTVLSNNLANEFEMDFLNERILAPNNSGRDSLIKISSDSISTVIPVTSGASVVTDRIINEIEIETSALNVSSLKNDTNKNLLGQKFSVIDLLTAPSNSVYDESGELEINSTEVLPDDISLGVSLDFEHGARVTILPSTSIFTDEILINSDNLHFLLRLVPWNAKIQNTVEIGNFEINTRSIRTGESITANVNMTDGLGNELTEDPTIIIEVIAAGNIIKTIELSQDVGSNYTGTFEIDSNGFMTLKIMGFLEGSGFTSSDTEEIFVKSTISSFNDFSDLSILIIIIFVLSLGMFVLVVNRTSNED